jgi:GNAT superfamily N-acetyltransferase
VAFADTGVSDGMPLEEANRSAKTQGTLRIRRFEVRDAELVWELHRAAIATTGADAGDDFYADLRDIPGAYLERGGEFLLGFAGDELAAAGGYVRLSAEEVEIRRMRVHPRHQRRGFGQSLLEALEAGARTRGYRLAYLETTELQRAGLALYRKNGYGEVARCVKQGYPVICFRKTLSA